MPFLSHYRTSPSNRPSDFLAIDPPIKCHSVAIHAAAPNG
jgi:hypothetical protein